MTIENSNGNDTTGKGELLNKQPWQAPLLTTYQPVSETQGLPGPGIDGISNRS